MWDLIYFHFYSAVVNSSSSSYNTKEVLNTHRYRDKIKTVKTQATLHILFVLKDFLESILHVINPKVAYFMIKFCSVFSKRNMPRQDHQHEQNDYLQKQSCLDM